LLLSNVKENISGVSYAPDDIYKVKEIETKMAYWTKRKETRKIGSLFASGVSKYE